MEANQRERAAAEAEMERLGREHAARLKAEAEELARLEKEELAELQARFRFRSGL